MKYFGLRTVLSHLWQLLKQSDIWSVNSPGVILWDWKSVFP